MSLGRLSPQNLVLVSFGKKPRRGMAGPGGKQLYTMLLFLIVSSKGFTLSPLPPLPPFSCPAFTLSTDSWVIVFQLHPFVSNPPSVSGFPSTLSLLSKAVSHHTRPPQPHWDLAFWTSNCHLHHSGLRGLRTHTP